MFQLFYLFVLQVIFLWGFVRLNRPVTVLESLKRFLHIIARKKTNLQYKNILTNAVGNCVLLTEK